MPVQCKYDLDNDILGFDFRGSITVQEFSEALASIPEKGPAKIEVNHVCRFHHDTDLSGVTANDLRHVNDLIKDHYAAIGLVRKKDACVLDGSVDAQLVMPLWRALCNLDPDVGVEVEFFSTSAEAADWLNIDHEIIQGIISDD